MDDTSHFEDLPDTFLGISSNKYPLVITFHKFLIMLDGTVGTSFFARYSEVKDFLHGKSTSSRSVALENFLRTKKVIFDRFCALYWVHFNSELKKKLDPSRVFTEIISHIKGGLKNGKVCEGILSRKAYILLSEGKASTLSEQIREIIYDIFQDYEKCKVHKCEFDLADLVNDLHYRLGHSKFEGEEFDFVYIDEVQDLTMKQIALFKYICRNVDEGFVFAGDTAQTIARGIDFRFQDIRSLFYTEFLLDSKIKKNMSELLCLEQNFRTHDGMLRLAQSVIDLIYSFFPHNVDILDPEESLICGEEPVILEPADGENAIVTIFGKGGNQNISENFIGFGAEQVILVRDDFARKEISAHVGKQALVLTIVECKGLEFQDVLLYNFFGSSPLKNQWRVIYGYMKKHNIFDNSCQSFTRFNQARHNILCSELKQLYVAITRTRQRLWICENIEDFSKPMFDYWKKKSFVQVKKLDDSLAQAMQVASSPEEWKTRGVKVVLASSSREVVGILTPETRIVRKRLVLLQLKSWVLGKIYLMKCGENKLHKSGECFSLAGCYELAAEVYAKGHFISECLLVCSKGKLFNMGLKHIQNWKQLDHKSEDLGKIEQTFLENCAFQCYEIKDNNSMMKFIKAFHTIDSVRCFLKKFNCFDELLLVEEEFGNFIEASEIANCKGDILREAELLGKANKFKEASMLMLWYVFANSLWVFNSTGWPLKPFSGTEEILAKAILIAEKESESDSYLEFISTEVNLLRQEEIDVSQLNNYLNISRINNSLRGEFLSIRKILDIHLHKRASKYEWEEELLGEDLVNLCEDKLSRNCVSIGTLNYIWNLLREKIENILKQATLLESQDSKDYVDIDEFCFNYFGVRRKIQGVDVVYLLINSEAYWAIGIDERFLQKKGNSAYIHIQQFAFAMRNHFRSELTSLGFKLLDTFDALHKFAKKNSLSAFCQSTPLIHIFEVTKYLLESKVLDVKYNDVKNLKIILDTTSVYFDYVFPLDWRKILAENMISLRRSDISRRLLHETCLKIGLKGKPAYGAFGRAVMIMLVSGKPSKEFAGIFSKAAEDFPSKELFREIGWEKDNEIPESSSVNASDPNKFLLVLLKICSENWRAYGFISPNCFLYQVELLLLRSSFTRELFFTTKSSLVKWIIGGDSYFGDDVRLLMDDVYAFLATIIVKFIFGRQEVTEWIKKSGLNFNSYYPLLLLRLVVTLCLLCANCNKYFHILFHFLEKDDLTTWLPRDFIDVLKRKKGKNYLIMNANKNMKILAEALMKVGDPLFIVSTSKNRCNLNCPLAIFVDRNSASCKDNVLKILFSKKSEVLQGQDVEAEASNDNNCKSGRIMFTSREETTSDFFMTSKQVSALKEKFQGYEALDKDDWKQLTSALDNGELDMSVSIMHMTMGKQLAITGDPAIKAFMDDWIKYITKENDASISRKDRNNSHNAETTGSSSKGKRNEKEDTNIDSENKGKGKSKSNKEKDG